MNTFSKWLGAGLGFTFGGPIGAIIGFALGSFVDGFSIQDFNTAKREFESNSNSSQRHTQSGDFEISLLVLASIVIKADGKIDRRELDFVRAQFVGMYGKERANNAFKLFKGIVKENVATHQVCLQIRQFMPHASRLQLLHFLFGIAKADEFVSEQEVDEIRKIANYLNINSRDYGSIKAMFYQESDAAYKILEIDKSASDSDLKKVYRKMAKKYHPDKLQGLGDEHLKGAQEKFQKIQSAYEAIKKQRGIS